WGYVSWRLSPSTTPSPEESPTACQCLAISHDGGQSWQQLPPPPKYLENFMFKFVDESVGWGVTDTTTQRGWEAGLFRTMDSGISWKEATLPSEITSSAVNLLAAIDERTAWLSFCPEGECSQLNLAVTQDGGATWKYSPSPCEDAALRVPGGPAPYFIPSFLS